MSEFFHELWPLSVFRRRMPFRRLVHGQNEYQLSDFWTVRGRPSPVASRERHVNCSGVLRAGSPLTATTAGQSLVTTDHQDKQRLDARSEETT